MCPHRKLKSLRFSFNYADLLFTRLQLLPAAYWIKPRLLCVGFRALRNLASFLPITFSSSLPPLHKPHSGAKSAGSVGRPQSLPGCCHGLPSPPDASSLLIHLLKLPPPSRVEHKPFPIRPAGGPLTVDCPLGPLVALPAGTLLDSSRTLLPAATGTLSSSAASQAPSMEPRGGAFSAPAPGPAHAHGPAQVLSEGSQCTAGARLSCQ